ncbi:hypothetical protein V8B97DRAFT_1370665 [Scleroderma yunnanense]
MITKKLICSVVPYYVLPEIEQNHVESPAQSMSYIVQGYSLYFTNPGRIVFSHTTPPGLQVTLGLATTMALRFCRRRNRWWKIYVGTHTADDTRCAPVDCFFTISLRGFMQIYQLQTEDDEETLGGTCYLLCTCGVRMSWNTIQITSPMPSPGHILRLCGEDKETSSNQIGLSVFVVQRLDPRDEWQRYHCCGSDRRMRAVPKSPDWAELCRLFLDSRTYLTGAIDLAICELLPPHLPRFLALSNSGLPSIRGPSRRPMTNTLCSSFMVEKRVPSLMTSPRSSV